MLGQLTLSDALVAAAGSAPPCVPFMLACLLGVSGMRRVVALLVGASAVNMESSKSTMPDRDLLRLLLSSDSDLLAAALLAASSLVLRSCRLQACAVGLVLNLATEISTETLV